MAAYADTHPLVTDGCVVVARHSSVASTLPAAGHPVKPFLFLRGQIESDMLLKSSSPEENEAALHCTALPPTCHDMPRYHYIPYHTSPSNACWPGVSGADRAETAASACMGIDPTSRPLLCMQMRQSMVSLTVTEISFVSYGSRADPHPALVDQLRPHHRRHHHKPPVRVPASQTTSRNYEVIMALPLHWPLLLGAGGAPAGWVGWWPTHWTTGTRGRVFFYRQAPPTPRRAPSS